MTKTENYGLNQWNAADRVLMSDFNEDNAKIDAAIASVAAVAGNCRVVSGTYTGTGTYDNANTNVKLSLGAKPILMLIYGGEYGAIIIDAKEGFSFYNTANIRSISCSCTDAGVVSWTSSGSASTQMNASGTTYTYYAFFL